MLCPVCYLGNDSELPLNPIFSCAFHYSCHLLHCPAHFEAATALHVALAGTELPCRYFSGAHLQNGSSSGQNKGAQSSPGSVRAVLGAGDQQSLSAGAAPLGQSQCQRQHRGHWQPVTALVTELCVWKVP